MGRLRSFWQRLRGWQKVALAGVAIILFLFVFFVVSYETVHYTESTAFCSTCHTVMEPEVVPHQFSAHANVTCADCHIGPGIEWKLYYKVSALRYLWTLPLGLYNRPLASPRETMRSTDEICEQCHSPDNFQPVSVEADYEYATDEANTLHRLLLARKIGNGQEVVAGQNIGAHWHVQNPVYFFTTDDLRQNIPWVQVETDGELVVYVDSEADPAIWADAEAHKQQMDCIDCHSRVGHTVHQPAELVDQAMAQGLIAPDLPSIKAQSVAVLEQEYATKTEGFETIDVSLHEFYETQYPDEYAGRQAELEQAVEQVQAIYNRTHFPAMNVYWDTYPNDIGHKDFPGCMRCHNGNHLNEQGEAIPAECNLCHGIPQEAGPDEPLPNISLGQGEMPESHQSSLWIAEHRYRFDATCDDCHTVNDPGGISNTSFCSNSGCHASELTYLQIDSPAVLALVISEELPSERRLPRIPHPVVDDMDCQACHGPDEALAYPEDHAEYGPDECTDCHRLGEEVLADLPPEPTPAAMTSPAMTIPAISHELASNENCLACHAVNSNIDPAPVTHADFVNETCLQCHQLAPEFVTLPTSTPTLAPTPTSTPLPSPTATLMPTEEATTITPTLTPPSEVTGTPATATVESAQFPAILHPIQGNENCLACHAVSSPIEPAPPNHAGFTTESCQTCHLP